MTTFIRVLEAAVDEKAAHLKSAVDALREGRKSEIPTFSVAVEEFYAVPRSPFSYWLRNTVRSLFYLNEPLEASGREACSGATTNDDQRFLRLWFEVDEARVATAPGCAQQKNWHALAKGGEHARFFSDSPLVINWGNDGHSVKAHISDYRGKRGWGFQWSAALNGHANYFRPGLTWSRRSQKGLSIRALPAHCIFGDKGPAVFVPNDSRDELLVLMTITNSRIFRDLVATQMAFGSYEVGVLERTPLPNVGGADLRVIGDLARRAWSLKRSLDTVKETSHVFVLPSGLNERITGLDTAAVETELAQIQRQIDDRAFELYGIGPEDRALIESASRTTVKSGDGTAEASDDEEDADTDAGTLDAGEQAAVASWLVGVAFGRFDPRLATGERAVPPEPEPFDPLPVRSPGMWPEGEAPKDTPDILVDDEGHGADLTARVRQIAERVHWQPPENLRAWLAREFFSLHIKMYSKSRRKAPIYWQLAMTSGSYSVWLYLHALTKDSLFRVQHEYAGPKLLHEEQRLESLRREFGENPSRGERKQITEQESFVSELRAFLEEVERVSPLWKPDLDDGVIINFAPLWRLVPHCTSWQRELKSIWDALCEGKYDWAHLAMHLWPERVVPKCAQDRSVAITHGLEEVFWAENSEGKWVAREVPTRSIAELVRERTSPAVKAALESLLQSSVAQNGGRSRGRRARATGAV